MSFVTFSRLPRTSRAGLRREGYLRHIKAMTMVMTEGFSLFAAAPRNPMTRSLRSWKNMADLRTSELDVLHKHLSNLSGKNPKLAIPQTWRFLKLCFPHLFKTRKARLRRQRKALMESNRFLPLPRSSNDNGQQPVPPSIGHSNGVSPSSCVGGESLCQRRLSMDVPILQLYLPFLEFNDTSRSGGACSTPFTPLGQIMHTPPCPPEIQRFPDRDTIHPTSTSPGWATQACLIPIFETAMVNINCRRSTISPPVLMNVPRRLSYSNVSNATGRGNNLATSNGTSTGCAESIWAEYLASPVNLKSSSCVPGSPADRASGSRCQDSFFCFQGSPPTMKV